MRASIRDADALRAVTPAALSAYARAAGWSAREPYRKHSDVYEGEGRPEIIIPRTEHLGDYASIVAAMVETFAQVADEDELTIYRSLVTADRDVVRVRVVPSDDGSMTLNDGADLIGSARDLFLSVACSLHDPQPAYPTTANSDAVGLVRRMHLDQTNQGNFSVTLLTPVVPPPIPTPYPDPDDSNAPIERRMIRHLMEALSAARKMVERPAVVERTSFATSVASGVSANLCEALVRIIAPFRTLDVGASWARTRPMSVPAALVRFDLAAAALLKDAARSLREQASSRQADGH